MHINQNINYALFFIIAFTSSVLLANDKVAEVYGRDIYRSEISLADDEKKILEQAKPEEIVQYTKLAEVKNLRSIVFQQANSIILGKDSYKPAQEEIESFVIEVTARLSKKGHLQNLTKEQIESFQESQKDIAYRAIEQWNVNRRLFEVYGGRVIYQQIGLEPVDAYRDFIKEIINSGKVKIIAPEFKSILSSPKINEHNVYVDEKDIKHGFSNPWWKTNI